MTIFCIIATTLSVNLFLLGYSFIKYFENMLHKVVFYLISSFYYVKLIY